MDRANPDSVVGASLNGILDDWPTGQLRKRLPVFAEREATDDDFLLHFERRTERNSVEVREIPISRRNLEKCLGAAAPVDAFRQYIADVDRA
jgi:hypothetical protein